MDEVPQKTMWCTFHINILLHNPEALLLWDFVVALAEVPSTVYEEQ